MLLVVAVISAASVLVAASLTHGLASRRERLNRLQDLRRAALAEFFAVVQEFHIFVGRLRELESDLAKVPEEVEEVIENSLHGIRLRFRHSAMRSARKISADVRETILKYETAVERTATDLEPIQVKSMGAKANLVLLCSVALYESVTDVLNTAGEDDWQAFEVAIIKFLVEAHNDLDDKRLKQHLQLRMIPWFWRRHTDPQRSTAEVLASQTWADRGDLAAKLEEDATRA